MDAKVDLPLLGAGPIAEGVLGEDTPANRRKIYYWHSQGVIPTFLWAKQLALFPEEPPHPHRRIKGRKPRGAIAPARAVARQGGGRGPPRSYAAGTCACHELDRKVRKEGDRPRVFEVRADRANTTSNQRECRRTREKPNASHR